MAMNSPLIKTIRTKELAVLFTCPICLKLIKKATTITECLHSFCRNCIYRKLGDEDVHTCPVCNVDLGCAPVRTLRPDFKLRSLKVSLLRVQKTQKRDNTAQERVKEGENAKGKGNVLEKLPVEHEGKNPRNRRKERSLSSLLPINEESRAEKEISSKDPMDHKQRSNTCRARRKQDTPNVESVNEAMTKPFEAMDDIWKPLQCLAEASTRRCSKGIVIRSSPSLPPPTGDKKEESSSKSKGKKPMESSSIAPKKEKLGPKVSMQATERPNTNDRGKQENVAATSRGTPVMPQIVVDAASYLIEKKLDSIWVRLVASDHQEGKPPLKSLGAKCFVRIKFNSDNPPCVSFIKRFLMKRLELNSEDEIDIFLHSWLLPPCLELLDVLELWTKEICSSVKQTVRAGSSTEDFVMVLSYACSPHLNKLSS